MTVEKLDKAIEIYYNHLLENNAEFKKFVEDNKGKTTEEIIKDNNIDVGDYVKVHNAINRYFIGLVNE